MKTRPFKELADEVRSRPGAAEEIDARRNAILAAMTLAEIRSKRHKTQTDLGEAIDRSQVSISRIERGGDLYLSTLADYIEGLGGHLEVSAVFDDEEVIPIKIGDRLAESR